MERRTALSNSHKCNGIITLSCSLGAAAAEALCSAGEMHCDIAVYLWCREQRSTDPQHARDSCLLAQTSLCCSFTAATINKIHTSVPKKKKKKEMTLLIGLIHQCFVVPFGLWLTVCHSSSINSKWDVIVTSMGTLGWASCLGWRHLNFLCLCPVFVHSQQWELGSSDWSRAHSRGWGGYVQAWHGPLSWSETSALQRHSQEKEEQHILLLRL